MRYGIYRTDVLIFFSLFIVFFSRGLFAQELPETFQDLPPELRKGLPTPMSYDEYVIMKKKFNLSRIFLTAMIPGYGHYYADRKITSLSIFGIRTLGYALMGTGFVLQMNNLHDLFSLNNLPDTSLRRLENNVYLFLGGFILNAAGFFYDWAGAERSIESNKNKVLYKFGRC